MQLEREAFPLPPSTDAKEEADAPSAWQMHTCGGWGGTEGFGFERDGNPNGSGSIGAIRPNKRDI